MQSCGNMDRDATHGLVASCEPAPHDALEAEFFANALDDCLAAQGTVEQRRERLLRLVDSLYEHAAYKLQKLRSHPIGVRPSAEMDVDEVEVDPVSLIPARETGMWELEVQTWDLIRHILPLRYPDKAGSADRQESPTTEQYEVGDLWDRFISVSYSASERRAVLEWLHRSARRRPNVDDLVRDLQQNAERGELISHGWIHTRSALKLRKGYLGSSSPPDSPANNVSQSLAASERTPLVSNLDPDAVLRQGRQLQPQDEYFERAIWVGCLQLLQRGCSLDYLRDWCAERTEGWRAVSMSAFAVTTNGPQSGINLDPSSVALWRRMCYALARHGGTDKVERAVYGILSGDIQSVQKVCKTWDDFMFMHYNSLIRSEFDEYVLSQCPPEVSASIRQSFPIFDAVQYHGDATTTEKRLVRSLSTNSHTRTEASEPFKVLQAAIISNELPQFFYEQGLLLCQDQDATDKNNGLEPGRSMDRPDPNTLRVAAHLLILLSALDELCPSSSQPPTFSPEIHIRRVQEMVIGEYVSVLRLARLEELIPLYCSKLDAPHAYEVLSTSLRQVTDCNARRRQLNLIQRSRLDVVEFVKVQSQLALCRLERSPESSRVPHSAFRIMQDGPTSLKYGRFIKTDFFGEDPDTIHPDDEALICSLEWLLLVDEAWPYVFDIGVRAYEYLLRTMHLNAARQLANRVPVHRILQHRGHAGRQDELDTLWVPDKATEFWATRLASVNNLDMSPGYLATQARIFRDMEYLVRTLDTMETIAALTVLSGEWVGPMSTVFCLPLLNPYRETSRRRDFWTQVGNEVKNAKEFVQPILNGWLLTEGERPDLRTIREIYLPEAVLAYISTLHFAGTCLSKDYLLECLDVAAAVAEKESDIAACFIKTGRMQNLVEAFACCGKALTIVAGERKVTGSTTKKMRELGWSRDVWSVTS
ncbi:hypothetical protein ACRALDRAFT_1049406 [Sodiomyces alcalophilus JCM 7366]|uniref:uncharacterized protein n=1 Tax=Sodiomyces alcalophilus JCM 7366 TaxID=591952 RepID=UPI0039B55995